MILPSGFGLGIPHQNAELNLKYYGRTLSRFNPDCYHNWLFDLANSRYFPTLWDTSSVIDKRKQILNSPSAKKKKIWFLGNEPEVSIQSNMSPERFAWQVRYWKAKIGLPFAIPGILWGEDGRNWWSRYNKLDTPKPNAYHIHIYAYSATDWISQLEDALRTFHDRTLIITEYGGWMLYPMLQAEIMDSAWKAIHLREIIPAAFWFSSHYGSFDPFWLSTDCENNGGILTGVGNSFRSMTYRETHDTNLPLVMR